MRDEDRERMSSRYSEARQLRPAHREESLELTKEKATKRIVFTKDLIQGILAKKKIRCTYRKTPKVGTFLVLDSRFRRSSEAACLIHCYRAEEVHPRDLTDRDARLAGVDSAAKLRALFVGWYGALPEVMYHNTFRVVEKGSRS